MKKVYDDETLKKIQKVELDMLDDFNQLCEKHGIDYFAVGGTTIGCVRHQGFIPWDDDIDLGFTRKNFKKFLKVAEKEYGSKYSLLNFEKDSKYPLMTTRWVKNGTVFLEECFKDVKCNFGIFLDLYCFDNIPDNDFKMRMQGFWAWFWSKWMILRSVSTPVLYQDGWKKKIILLICRIINGVLNFFHIKPDTFYWKAQKHIRKYEHQKTKRVAYMFDPKPFMSIINKSDIFPTKKVPYESMYIRVPKNVEVYCKSRFGDYMTLPSEEKRHNHMPYKLDFGKEK